MEDMFLISDKNLDSRHQKYWDWIMENVPTDCLGDCREYTYKMVATFPELETQAGFYYDLIWGERMHWWCKAPDGTVVDPTAAQFPTKGTGKYVHVPEEERPVGKCMGCGGLVYAADYCPPSICSRECEIYVVSNI